MVTASLKNYRQSPRKVRLVATLIKGKSVDDALATLKFVNKRAKDALADLVLSAVANAKHNFNLDPKDLYIKDMRVDSGVTMKRSMPRARGSAYPIRKKSSAVNLVLDTKVQEKPKTKAKKA